MPSFIFLVYLFVSPYINQRGSEWSNQKIHRINLKRLTLDFLI